MQASVHQPARTGTPSERGQREQAAPHPATPLPARPTTQAQQSDECPNTVRCSFTGFKVKFGNLEDTPRIIRRGGGQDIPACTALGWPETPLPLPTFKAAAENPPLHAPAASPHMQKLVSDATLRFAPRQRASSESGLLDRPPLSQSSGSAGAKVLLGGVHTGCADTVHIPSKQPQHCGGWRYSQTGEDWDSSDEEDVMKEGAGAGTSEQALLGSDVQQQTNSTHTAGHEHAGGTAKARASTASLCLMRLAQSKANASKSEV